MNQISIYIEETLHKRTSISKYEDLSVLPLHLRNGYDFYLLTLQNIECLLARPKDQTNLTILRRQAGQLKKLTGLDIVLCLDDIRKYTKEKLLSEGIPFIITGKQLYMPFLGIALSKNDAREIAYTEKISFSTQRLLLTAIYQGWTQTTLTEAAGILGVSKMSVTRNFDELQALGLDLVRTIGKTRCFFPGGSRRDLWDAVFPHLRNPVARQYRLGMRIETGKFKLGGMSAICHYSMLNDNSYTVYSINKRNAKALDIARLPLISDNESPMMVVQVMNYDLDYRDAAAIDPLSAVLSVYGDDKNDPRVEAAIEEILEDCLYD